MKELDYWIYNYVWNGKSVFGACATEAQVVDALHEIALRIDTFPNGKVTWRKHTCPF